MTVLERCEAQTVITNAYEFIKKIIRCRSESVSCRIEVLLSDSAAHSTM